MLDYILIDHRMTADCQSLMYVGMVANQLVWTLVRGTLNHMMPQSLIANSTILMFGIFILSCKLSEAIDVIFVVVLVIG